MSSKVIINDRKKMDVSTKPGESETFRSQWSLLRWYIFATVVCGKKKQEILIFLVILSYRTKLSKKSE